MGYGPLAHFDGPSSTLARINSGQNGSKSLHIICRATILHFFLPNAEIIKFFTRSLRSMETSQRRRPNKSFNADIRHSEITG